MNLVIVESPTKARTIGKFLGSGFEIKASMGHLMDLPKKKLNVDIEHDFKPNFEVVADKAKTIAGIKKAAKSAEQIILATDPDREGEAIAAHVAEIISDKKSVRDKFKRIVFHEITKEAIEEALKNPRDINVNLVDAQTARRVLDRLVGYKLSPLLWQKVRRGLSAGRVQSIALRLIVEREREIEKFKKEEYWTIIAKFKKEVEIEFELIEINGEKIEKSTKFTLYDGEYNVAKTNIDNEQKSSAIIADLKGKKFNVSDVLQKEMHRSPNPPYTTSTLQQDASRRLGLSGKRTMSLAQKLYEEGYISYHRTDSVSIALSAQSAIRGYVQKEYGDKYLPEKPRIYATKQKLAQEAHEAIRPTKIGVLGGEVRSELGDAYAKLYELIWRRALASQMSDAVIESTTVLVNSLEKKYTLKANGSVLAFDGFLKINPQALQDTRLPQFTVGENLNLVDALPEKHETPAPPRYNDASLIKTLEEKGIGRPSTYATIVSTIEARRYIERLEGRFTPTSIGIAVNDFLVENFSDIDDIPFTATMEDSLDNVAHGKENWVTMMKDFYTPFAKRLESVKDAKRVPIAVEKTDEKCEKCGEPLVVRTGRFGKFLSCGTFPKCDFSKPFIEETGFLCPKDNGKVIVRKTRKGRVFYGCSNYPKCDFAAWNLNELKHTQEGSQVNAEADSKTESAVQEKV